MSTFRYLHAAESTKTPAHQQNAKRKRILVVEDNQLSSKLLKQLLTAHGYKVVETPDGLQALDLARDEQPDLILMDLRLPDINGLEVTRLLKQDERTKTIPIIAVTALATPDLKREVSRADAMTLSPNRLYSVSPCGSSNRYLNIRPVTLTTFGSRGSPAGLTPSKLASSSSTF